MLSFVGADSPAFFDIRGNISKGTGSVILVPPLALRVGRQNLKKETETSLTASNNDGSFSAWELGTDYYIYACRPNEGASPVYILSANSTYPNGYDDTNSRKIGGFHYGIVRTGPNPGDVEEGIVPNSVWDLQNRPRCSPEGMVKVRNIWVDIYQASDDGQGGIKSAYNATPLTGTEDLNWYGFVERAAKVGKRLLTYAEWCAAAQGSPQGNDSDNVNAWSATIGRNPTGVIANATSSYNLRDCVGNVWEWLDELITRGEHEVLQGTGTFPAYDGGRANMQYTNGNGHGTTGIWGWDTYSPFPGYGNIYQFYDYSLSVLRAGGVWNDGAKCGSHTAHLSDWPWYVSPGSGCRAACDAL